MTKEMKEYIERIEKKCKKFFASPKGPETLLHFTHVSDADGIGCDALTHAFLRDLYSIDNLKVFRCSYDNMQDIIYQECGTLMEEGKMFRVLITDLNVNPDIIGYLGRYGINWFWIDHHVLPKALLKVTSYPGDITSKIMSFFEEYPENLFADYFGSSEVFNPTNYGGCVKYSAFALYYVALVMGDVIGPKGFCHIDDVERGIIESLSNSDTYLFKKAVAQGQINPYWVPSNKYVDDTESTIYVRYIVDIYPVIMKGMGADALHTILVRMLKSEYGTCTTPIQVLREEASEFLLAQLIHEARVPQYRFFKKAIEYFAEPELGKVAFIPEPSSEISIFSTWLFDEYPDVSATLGIYTSSRIVSMRSPDNGPDVSKYCTSHFNGGGHKNAAGGKIGAEDYMNILRAYYASRERTEEERAESLFTLTI